ncbi:putative leucine-rich repeat domain, L domain-containing protein [Lupinus albus]|uniref:Putative leucine-rich repeat domain, L domain-containing protein n=1 Tax=Lupinus albus TaxID=3870 RepID=A0A6A4PWD4_LUPAL|nr:putative leucine-rich repeat domain, L domain-containing protein [Lupinus albus]
MGNLGVLIILCDLSLPLGLKCLSSSLKVLEWKGYPLEYLPLGLQLLELLHLKMHCSKLKRVWNGTQIFRELKSIDLSDSRDLIQTPNISEVPCLESLVLKGCINLVEVHQSVAKHKNVAMLDLEGCISLKTLPRKLEMNALEKLILSGCSQIKKLPKFGESMECLSILNLRDCTSLVCLPQSIRNMKSFRDLNIHGCSKLFRMTNNSNKNNVVEEIDDTETAMREVHSSAIDLKSLNMLLNKGYDWLITNSSFSLLTEKVFDFIKYPVSMGSMLPPLSSFPRLKKLNMGNCNLSDGSIIDHIGHLTSLEVLYLAGNNFVDLTASIGNLSRLQRLGLYKCQRLRTLPELPPSVCQLLMNDCTQLEPMLFDTQRIWKIFEANRWNLTRELWFLIPGSEIPPWF